MKHGSVFSGIGGFDLASEWMGWKNIFSCEINPFGRKILEYYWPNAIHYEDIKKTKFNKEKIDVLTGGFPCQDASIANTKGTPGLNGKRTGLFYEMLRAIKESSPNFIVAENVENILRTNNGRDFAAIISELVRMGYSAEWRVTRASEVGAPHNRSRCYVVAYPNSIRLQEDESFFSFVDKEVSSERRNIAGTTSSVWVSWEDEPKVSCLDDDVSFKLDGITFPKWTYESIMGYGNAILPIIAYNIFQRIQFIKDKYNI